MSCNPSIGGVGKGHLVRELDVFDGLMARAADRAAIHRRMLNRSKGPAVWGPRVQADRELYRAAIADAARRAAASRSSSAKRCATARSSRVGSPASRPAAACSRAAPLVIATGTFLDARMFVGDEIVAGGRRGERGVGPLAAQIREIGLGQGRLKTGTPPRLDGRTIDWARLEEQPSDAEALDDVGARRRPSPAATALRNHPDQRTHARHHSRELRPIAAVRRRDRGPGAALLPVDRGQGEALRRPRCAPDFPRARGT